MWEWAKPDGLIYLIELEAWSMETLKGHYKVGFSRNLKTLEQRIGVPKQWGMPGARVVCSWPSLRQWERQFRWVLSVVTSSDWPGMPGADPHGNVLTVGGALARYPHEAPERFPGHETFYSAMSADQLETAGHHLHYLLKESYEFDEYGDSDEETPGEDA